MRLCFVFVISEGGGGVVFDGGKCHTGFVCTRYIYGSVGHFSVVVTGWLNWSSYARGGEIYFAGSCTIPTSRSVDLKKNLAVAVDELAE